MSFKVYFLITLLVVSFICLVYYIKHIKSVMKSLREKISDLEAKNSELTDNVRYALYPEVLTHLISLLEQPHPEKLVLDSWQYERDVQYADHTSRYDIFSHFLYGDGRIVVNEKTFYPKNEKEIARYFGRAAFWWQYLELYNFLKRHDAKMREQFALEKIAPNKNYSDIGQTDFEYRLLHGYMKWLKSQYEYTNFSMWCEDRITYKDFTLDWLLATILTTELYEGGSYAGIQKILSDMYHAYYLQECPEEDDDEFPALCFDDIELKATKNFKKLVDEYYIPDDY